MQSLTWEAYTLTWVTPVQGEYNNQGEHINQGEHKNMCEHIDLATCNS